MISPNGQVYDMNKYANLRIMLFRLKLRTISFMWTVSPLKRVAYGLVVNIQSSYDYAMLCYVYDLCMLWQD